MAHLPHPPWHRNNCRYINIAFLTRIIIHYASSLYVAAQLALARKKQEEQQQVMCFQDTSDSQYDSSSISSASGIDDNAPCASQLNNASSRVCTTDKLRLKQNVSVEKIVLDEECHIKLVSAGC